MKYRLTLIYLAAAVLLVGLYLYDTRREQAKENLSREAARLFQSPADRMEAVVIKRKSGEINIEKTDLDGKTKWQITSPVRTGADSMTITALTRSLAGLRYKSVVSENADLPQFGLDQPDLIVSFRAGEKGDTISFGAPNPLGEGVYARRAEGRTVYLIAAADKKDLDKSLYDLRSKELFTLGAEQVNRVVLTLGSERWSLNRKEGEWFLEGDDSFRADRETVESLISTTIAAYPNSFEEEKAADLSPFGLARPKARVALSDGKKTEEIAYGDSLKQGKEELIYAALTGKPQVVSVRKRMLEDLPKGREDLRPKEPEKKEE